MKQVANPTQAMCFLLKYIYSTANQSGTQVNIAISCIHTVAAINKHRAALFFICAAIRVIRYMTYSGYPWVLKKNAPHREKKKAQTSKYIYIVVLCTAVTKRKTHNKSPHPTDSCTKAMK